MNTEEFKRFLYLQISALIQREKEATLRIWASDGNNPFIQSRSGKEWIIAGGKLHCKASLVSQLILEKKTIEGVVSKAKENYPRVNIQVLFDDEKIIMKIIITLETTQAT